jgi:prepilin peptidase CpaA
MSATVVALIVLKAVAIALLAKIAVTDFRIQKIRNADLAPLLAIALAVMALEYLRQPDLARTLTAAAIAAVLFLVLIAFWLLGKVGAGDVKLLTIIPMLVGVEGSGPFMIALLLATALAAAVMKYPVLLPERLFRSYVTTLAQSGRVPFGVPIGSAAIVGLLFTAL